MQPACAMKKHVRVNREGLWKVQKIYGVGGQLPGGIKVFYKEANVHVRVHGKLSESFHIGV